MTRRALLAAALLTAVAVVGCSGEGTETIDLRVAEGDIVEVHYEGRLADGTMFESSRDNGTPFTFTAGSEQVITGFDRAVSGLGVGDTVTVTVPPEDAYGMPSDDNVFEVPIAPGQQNVAVGDEVSLSNGRPGVVIEVKEDSVVIDANHRLAGETLTFDIEVLSITRPTAS